MLTTTPPHVTYAGNGSLIAFSVTFKFVANAELDVYLATAAGVLTLQTITTHYTVSGAGNAAGGTVTFIVAPTAAQRVLIIRDSTRTQLIDLRNQGPWNATNSEAAIDRLTRLAQEIGDIAERGVRISPLDDTGAFATQIVGPPTALYVPRVNAAATGFELVTSSDILSSAVILDGLGTANFIPLWTDPNTLANSMMSQNAGATILTLTGNGVVTGTLAVTGAVTLTVPLAVGSGGTGLASGTSGELPFISAW